MTSFAACSGRPALAVVLGSAHTANPSVLALSERLADIEEDRPGGSPAAPVVVCVHGVGLEAQLEVLQWLLQTGRPVVVRTRVALPRGWVEHCARAEIPVLLEIAHPHAGVQRALYGDQAHRAGALLLHAQLLAARGVRRLAWVGPLLEGVHTDTVMRAILLHVRSAGIREVRTAAARLDRTAVQRLGEILPPEQLRAVLRPFGASLDGTTPELLQRDRAARWSLRAAATRHAESLGLTVGGCGCPAHCDLAGVARDVIARPRQGELFAS